MENTPRNIVLQLGALITLYLSASFLLTLVFGLINLSYPDAADSYWQIEDAANSVRIGIAMLVVFFPTYLVLTRYVNKFRRAESNPHYQHFTKWLMYLSLLVGGLVLLGTLVTVLYTFLNGDLTTRFILKAVAVLGVVGMAFHYYILDARGYWIKEEGQSIMFAIGIGLVVFLAIAFGLKNIETPAVVREMKIDEEQIEDLRTIQYQIDAYRVVSSSTLPASLDDLYRDDTEGAIIGTAESFTAPEGREPYSYELTEQGFALCATFAHDSATHDFVDKPYLGTAGIINAEDWQYKAGRHCFNRIVKQSTLN